MINSDLKLRFLRALAFEIHRKQPPVQAMADCIEKAGQKGKHRELRPAAAVLDEEGLAAAMRVAGLIGDETAVVLAEVVNSGDHRLLAGAISALADHLEQAIALGQD
ncbi:MAG: hypothetical protein F8N37_06670 [Telmatospirillum sp.]|nr:hypothetical protein [Telmatospirillum sp.]